MGEICFRYNAAFVARGVVDDIRRLHPAAAGPHLGGRQAPDVVHLPITLWERPLVPELALGLGGRLVACQPAPDDVSCVAPAGTGTDRAGETP